MDIHHYIHYNPFFRLRLCLYSRYTLLFWVKKGIRVPRKSSPYSLPNTTIGGIRQMKKEKTSIKTLPKTEVREQEGGEIKNRVVFTMFCKNVVDQIKKQLPKKPASVKQIVTYSLVSMDEGVKREVMEAIRNNKKYDKTIDGFIINNKKNIVDFFEKQKDKENSVSYLKQRVQELESKLGKGGKSE